MRPIPVVDLFAGPGGLQEGFSSVCNAAGARVFDVRLSIEKDPVACRTLWLRTLFRNFQDGRVPDSYYDYVRGDITMMELKLHRLLTDAGRMADEVTRNATLGETPLETVDRWIRKAIGNGGPWVLIGGPPCQAYSIAGRSRMRCVDPGAFESDSRHFLYKEYLRIIRDFSPSVFIMENVKGILTSRYHGSLIFERILEDLSKPGNGHEYDIRSFVVNGSDHKPRAEDFVIMSEDFGVPQMRHRVILFGVRSDHSWVDHDVLVPATNRVSVCQALSGLPPLRSRLSREPDSFDSWLQAVAEAPAKIEGKKGILKRIGERMHEGAVNAKAHHSTGNLFVTGDVHADASISAELCSWYNDLRLGGCSLHETRAHMRSDLHRYLFASCYAAEFGCSPKLSEFPARLLPDHGNLEQQRLPFADRFRVQLDHHPSSTVVSHISKDGHYYIHPDPSQCRSLTVREVARLQTFPDNYFFEGNRTEQYVQVGNAVPPFLAYQIAKIVLAFLLKMAEGRSSQAERSPWLDHRHQSTDGLHCQ